MRLATLKDGSVVALTPKASIPLEKIGFNGDMKQIIAGGTETLNEIRKVTASATEGIPLQAEAFTAPLSNPNKIVAIGLNYTGHADESKMEVPKTPLVFAKFPSSITGPTGDIIFSTRLTNKVDYEVELAVIIGKEAKNISREDALNYVFGYTILNDVSARDLQFSESQWVRAKSLDTFCPLGPVIVTADEIKNPQDLELGCEVNGQSLQHDNTKNMVFGVADLISILSHSFKFEPGDIIATGTPSGVGFSREPPIYLKDGDLVRSWIKGIGELLNFVKSTP